MKIAANISVLFREHALLDRFEAARSAGFDGVEMQFPYDQSPTDLAHARLESGLPVVLINGPINRETLPFGICGRPEMRALFLEQLPLIATYARAVGARRVHLLSGTLRCADEADDCWRTYTDNLLLAAEVLGADGIRVLIEPINSIDAPNYLLSSFDAARNIVERCQNRIGLQFDVYHASRMQLDPARELQRLLPIVDHVQFADSPGRHEPGSGKIKFGPVLEALRNARYAGWLAAEYSPATTTEAGLQWLAEWRSAIAANHSG
jgi:hydroxypyruvate isomerase